MSFDVHTSYDIGPITSYDSLEFAGASYAYDVTATHAHQNIRPNVVHMINDTDILVVSWFGGNTIWAASQCMIMNSRTQPVMIGKKLAQELRLTVDDLAPCPFTIGTSLATWIGPRIILKSHYSLEIHPHLFFFGVR